MFRVSRFSGLRRFPEPGQPLNTGIMFKVSRFSGVVVFRGRCGPWETEAGLNFVIFTVAPFSGAGTVPGSQSHV